MNRQSGIVAGKSDCVQTKILLVEDNPLDARLVTGMIERAENLTGEVIHAARLSEALDFLSADQFSVILLDLNLPDSIGLETLGRIHQVASQIPVIVVTGQDDEALAVNAAEKGAQDYLVKGEFNRNLLIRTIRYAITRKKNEVERLRLVAAIEQATDSIIITDKDGRVLFVNPAFEKTTGYSMAEMSGKTPRVLKSGKHGPEFYRDLWSAITNGETWNGHFINKKKNGPFFDEEATISPVRDEAGEIINFVSVGRDVTAKLALEAQLSQAQKLESIGRLAAGIAHEINTPIQYIGDNVRFLQGSFGDLSGLLEKYGGYFTETKAGRANEEVTQSVAESIEAVDLPYLIEEIPRSIEETLEGVAHVAKIVLAMKEFSHPGSKEKVPTNLNKAIENTAAVSRNEWKYVATVETDLDPDLPLVPCLPGEMNQVFLNTIVNSAHSISERFAGQSEVQGRIRICTRSSDGHVEVRISDNGAGIPEGIRDKILDPFFTTKGVGRGTGQGLAIARSVIVDKHSGKIGFESEVGKGTTFVIRLPMFDGEEEDRHEEASSLRG